jgi:acetoin utilization deacetylase AcuC-like enzyme
VTVRSAPAVVLDPRCVEHDPGAGHPERPDRLRTLIDLLEGEDAPDVVRLPAREAEDEELLRVHTPDYLELLAATAHRERTVLDPDTSASGGSWRAARLSAGGLLSLVDAVVAGEVERGISLLRPPGHHAEASLPRGFCMLNNVAVAAAHLRRRHGIERILIADIDVHHGNGTQHVFEADPDVLYLSLHQFPFYPGTGAIGETGFGEGRGRTVNLPLPAGCGDGEYREAFVRVVEPIARAFAPEFVLVSVGFDGDARDPLAAMRLTVDGYRDMFRRLLRIAREFTDGRIAMVLEGGYDLTALREGVVAVLDELAHDREPVRGGTEETAISPLLDRIVDVQGEFWPLGGGR